MATLDLKDGYYDVPAGKLVSVVTQLEMHAPPDRALAFLDSPWHLEALTGADSLAQYRELFRAVGEEWLWFSRRVMPDEQLAALLEDPAIECFALTDGAHRAGILELDFREPATCELAFFGLARKFQGRGLGRALVDEAIRRAFARPIARFWVHTCTHDSPDALPFYIKSGFSACGRQIEVHDDYRLSGQLPRSAAPHVPVLEPDT